MLRTISGIFLLCFTCAGLARAAGPVDSCALIDAAQLGKILNAQVGPGVMDPKPRPHCNFAVSGKGMLKTVSLWAYHESAKIAFENGKTGLAPIQSVPG